MSEFIDATELETYFKNIANEFGDGYKNINLEELSEHDKKLLSTLAEYLTRTIIAIEMFPRVDAEPIRHGSWLKDEEKSKRHIETIYICSACHNFEAWGETERYYYCPCCGAKMDLEGETE